MKIIYKEGDLLACPEKYILHGCNAQGVMGSGVAKLIRDKYPSAYDVYMLSKKKGEMELGGVTYAEQEDGRTIINAITQEFYGREPKRVYVSYDAIRDCFQRINWWINTCQEEKNIPISMPKIGAGLGGGDWDIIAEIIEIESKDFQPVVYTI